MEAVLEQLEEASSKLGIKVSYETLADTIGGGGFCKVKGQPRIIIDKRATVGDKVVTLARALAALDPAQIDGVFLPPAARELVEKQQALRAGARPGPR